MEPLTIDVLLYNSCSNPAEELGYNEYVIELCCVTYKVIARLVEGNKFEIKSYSAS